MAVDPAGLRRVSSSRKITAPTADATPKRAKDVASSERREEAIAGAIAVLAKAGAHGLTHREVDKHLRWPIGSTSNHFRKRNDMLVAIAERILELDLADLSGLQADLAQSGRISVGLVVGRMVELFERWMSPAHRNRSRARAEILIETTRNAELRAATTLNVGIAERWFHPVFAKLGAPDPATSAQLFSLLVSSIHVAVLIVKVMPSRPQLHAIVESWISMCSGMPEQATPASVVGDPPPRQRTRTM